MSKNVLNHYQIEQKSSNLELNKNLIKPKLCIRD